ncbi:teichoic acid D-Ala incorporation-associated protein DltX [Streptococcus infantis]|uniref:teichoic acid D-Ala incorporation-associated protein DltX n=1 Tax=Streptococcus infantis TaxID=68892 RepID=UPI0039C2958D
MKIYRKESNVNKKKPYYVFLGQTVLYFIILLGLLYFFSYLGQSQGGFIYNEF